MRLVKFNTAGGLRLETELRKIEARIQERVPEVAKWRMHRHGDTEPAANAFALRWGTKVLSEALEHYAKTAFVAEVIDPDVAKAANAERGE